ncbi:MAG: class I SAM-dependent methyltransferase [Bdellovibrionales bacterium]|nr:class I SAM-dependent methyltransferase [Bdellovibrionales bacterium]
MSHFNEMAAQWDSEDKIQMMKTLADQTKALLNNKSPIDIMDFGCGTGLFGLEFADQAKSLLGVDTSEGMLEIFNKKTEGHDNFQSQLIDLENENLNKKFDLIVSSMAFHHLKNPMAMIQKMKTMLNPDGKLAIVDLDHEDGTFHPDNKAMGVQHHGFSKEDIASWAKEAQMKLDHHIINKVHKNDKDYPQFLAIFS